MSDIEIVSEYCKCPIIDEQLPDWPEASKETCRIWFWEDEQTALVFNATFNFNVSILPLLYALPVPLPTKAINLSQSLASSYSDGQKLLLHKGGVAGVKNLQNMQM